MLKIKYLVIYRDEAESRTLITGFADQLRKNRASTSKINHHRCCRYHLRHHHYLGVIRQLLYHLPKLVETVK